MNITEVQNYLYLWGDKIIRFLPTLAGAILLVAVGFWLANKIDGWLRRFFEKREYEVSLEIFLRNFLKIGTKVFVVITAAGFLGFPAASLVAVFGAAGLAVGLALQGTLANFAGGVLILLFRPFKVRDLVTLANELGVVREIQIFNTIILTPDNKTIILPNGPISNGTIVNHSRRGYAMLETKFTVDFDEDVERVRKAVLDRLNADSRVLKEPKADVVVLGFTASAVQLSVRIFVHPKNYWDVYFNLAGAVRMILIENDVKRA